MTPCFSTRTDRYLDLVDGVVQCRLFWYRYLHEFHSCPEDVTNISLAQRRKQFNGNKKRWFSLKLFALICTVVTPSLLSWGVRTHFLHVRTLFTSSHHGRLNLQILSSWRFFSTFYKILSNLHPPPGACVASTFPPLGIVFDPYTHDNY